MDPKPPTSPLLGPPCPASQWALGPGFHSLRIEPSAEIGPAPAFDSITRYLLQNCTTPELHSAQSTVVALKKTRFCPQGLHSSRPEDQKKQVLKNADCDKLPEKGKQRVQEGHWSCGSWCYRGEMEAKMGEPRGSGQVD